MFLIGDEIFYPGFGAGDILNIEDRVIHGEIKKYYIIRFVDGLESMIPVYSSEASKIRMAVRRDECSRIYEIIRGSGEKLSERWNQRCRYYNETIKNGDIYALALLLSSIGELSKEKELSKSDERMFHTVLDFVEGEIALSCCSSRDEIRDNILKILREKGCKC